MPHHSKLKKPPPDQPTRITSVLQLPTELQVNLLTYLRAFDLASVQQTCRFYHNPRLVHAIVVHSATKVYPARLTQGFDEQPVLCRTTQGAAKASAKESDKNEEKLYTFEHLRNMELLVIARVLSQPEPSSGYIVSKSWCKTALKWLEICHEQQKKQHKKLSKKKQRLRQRRLSDASPPWPNVNSDLLCEHNSLQRCSNSKTARARRKLLDKQAWKILNKLYPDSTPLVSECVQCAAEAEICRKTEQVRLEQLKLERKQPLSDPMVRRFYTRTKGVPEQALRTTPSDNEDEDRKMPASGSCPLQPGRYYILPRAWCYGWRRYIRTGEGSTAAGSYPAPDAASLLCDAHRLLLLPPHLEAYLYGEQSQLFCMTDPPPTTTTTLEAVAATPPSRRSVPGQLDPESMQALLAAGLSPTEVRRQLTAMRSMEQEQQQEQQRPPPPPVSPETMKERLDRENHSVVEIVTADEFAALTSLWQAHHVFGVAFRVDGHCVHFDVPVCRACDPTGRAKQCVVRNRVRSKTSSTGLEY